MRCRSDVKTGDAFCGGYRGQRFFKARNEERVWHLRFGAHPVVPSLRVLASDNGTSHLMVKNALWTFRCASAMYLKCYVEKGQEQRVYTLKVRCRWIDCCGVVREGSVRRVPRQKVNRPSRRIRRSFHPMINSRVSVLRLRNGLVCCRPCSRLMSTDGCAMFVGVDRACNDHRLCC